MLSWKIIECKNIKFLLFSVKWFKLLHKEHSYGSFWLFLNTNDIQRIDLWKLIASEESYQSKINHREEYLHGCSWFIIVKNKSEHDHVSELWSTVTLLLIKMVLRPNYRGNVYKCFWNWIQRRIVTVRMLAWNC